MEIEHVLPQKTRTRPKRVGTWKDLMFVYMIVVPCLIYVLFIFYYPFIMNFYWMFFKYSFLSSPEYIGTKNIATFFHDKNVYSSFLNTFTITVVSTPLVVGLSLFIAMGLFHLKWSKGAMRSAIFSTYLMPVVAAAVLFKMMLGNTGLINAALKGLGLPMVPWLTNTHWAMSGIILFSVWKQLGYFTVITLAGLSNINGDLYEAASVDGATRIQRFWNITIPQMRFPLAFNFIIATIGYLSAYVEVSVITKGDPYGSTKTAVMYMFEQGFVSLKIGYASVIAMALFIIVLLVSYVQMKITKVQEE